MTERIVDHLEPVQVNEQHGKQALVALGQAYGFLRALAEQEAVGQAGEHIEVRQLLDAFAGSTLLRDVLGQAGDPFGFAVGVFDDRGNAQHQPALVAGQVFDFRGFLAALAGDHASYRVAQARARVLVKSSCQRVEGDWRAWLDAVDAVVLRPRGTRPVQVQVNPPIPAHRRNPVEQLAAPGALPGCPALIADMVQCLVQPRFAFAQCCSSSL